MNTEIKVAIGVGVFAIGFLTLCLTEQSKRLVQMNRLIYTQNYTIGIQDEQIATLSKGIPLMMYSPN